LSRVILENLVKEFQSNQPEFYKNIDLETFGIDWRLHEHQQKAVKHAINALYIYYNYPEYLYDYYKGNGINEYDYELSSYKGYKNFEVLSNYYPVQDDKIDFKNFINRASFWMATGSGKTLVIIKLIEALYNLIQHNYIPNKDIMVLAPKDDIIEQIKEHVARFNTNSNVKIELRDLRNWEKHKSKQLSITANNLIVYYYRSDNITYFNKTELLDFKTVLNNGEWFVILDEAHKGDSIESDKQQYYAILSKNSFLFNFSATFTDTIDIITTAYDFSLEKFIEEGYGKFIRVSGEQFANFNRNTDNDFSEEEKHVIVLKSLITLTAIKKEAEVIHSINQSLYHNPLLVTIANEVNTIEADLKIFFKQLSIIASGNDLYLESAKNDVVNDLISSPYFQFGKEPIPNRFFTLIKNITIEDILKYVFNASSPGIIEYTRIKNNSREIAFRLKTAEEGKHFGLLVASDSVNWSENVLSDYSYSQTPLTNSFFKDINSQKSDINILLGSRIFNEGWDSNRPNVINLINIGVNEEARKFILQAIGRGVRIQPYYGIRKRLNHLSIDEKEKIQEIIPPDKEEELLNNRNNIALESLHIFATNKEVIRNTIKGTKDISSKNWNAIKSVEKNHNLTTELLVARYETVNEKVPPYKMSQREYGELVDYVGQPGINDKLLLMQCPENVLKNLVSTLNNIRNKYGIEPVEKEAKTTPFNNLLKLNNHFQKKPRMCNKDNIF